MTQIYISLINLSLVLFLVFANAFFVVSEFSIVKIRRTKLEELAHSGSRRAKIALKINDHLNTYLSAIQLGITIASLGLGWIGEPAVSKLLEKVVAGFFADNPVLLHSVSFGIAFSFITLLHVVLGELVPKSLAIQATERYVLAVAPALYTFNRIFSPFIWVFDHLSIWILHLMGTKQATETEETHSEEEIKIIIDASQKGGIIDETEGEIIQNAIDFSEICAHEIMIPRQDIKCLYLHYTPEETLNFVKTHHHTRFPLCNKDRDHIVGMIHIRDILEHTGETQNKDFLNKICRKILFVPENKSISEILNEMMLQRTHLAIVVDEYGGTAGMLSMEDILEELVGDIRDEHDEQTCEPVKKIDDKVCEFDGVVLIEDAFECMNLPEIEHDESTIGGYVFGLLGREPKVGDTIEDDYCVYEVMAVNNMRITRVKTRLKDIQPAQEESEAKE
ncbi:MAG: hemolysin family protein [bacterium]|nr:hemolysin family protein [bacterium]MDY2830635.1 hemolysin family protein [Alphaproteobacteria bacterium]